MNLMAFIHRIASVRPVHAVEACEPLCPRIVVFTVIAFLVEAAATAGPVLACAGHPPVRRGPEHPEHPAFTPEYEPSVRAFSCLA
jgi:hypothetical protein